MPLSLLSTQGGNSQFPNNSCVVYLKTPCEEVPRTGITPPRGHTILTMFQGQDKQEWEWVSQQRQVSSMGLQAP